MKQKSSKGLLKLVIIIFIIVGIIVVLVNYIEELLHKEDINNVQNDLLLVQAKVELYAGNYNIDKDTNPLKGYQLTVLPENININDFLQKNIILQEDYSKYYLLDSRKFNRNGIRRISK